MISNKPLLSLAEKVAIPHTAILVIDMQNDFCSEKGSLALSGRDVSATRYLTPRLQRFLDAARRQNVTIIFIGSVRNEGDISLPMKELWIRTGHKTPICVRGSWGAEFIPEIQPRSGEIVIEKTRYSAFYKTDLDTKLRGRGIVTLVATGIATDVCVETTCRDGFMRDYYIVIPGDLVASYDKNLHDNALLTLSRNFATVTSSPELLRIWGVEG